MGTLSGKVALVTGGARGIGRETALKLASEGARVAVCDLGDARHDISANAYPLAKGSDIVETTRLVTEAGGECIPLTADVRSSVQLRNVAGAVIERYGCIDILATCAGISGFFNIHDMTDANWQGIIDVNLTGVANAMRAVVPHMIANRHGRIVVVGSLAARRGTAGNSPYSASKWGLIGLVKSAALELESKGITVNIVHPGPVDTMMNNNPAVIAWKGKAPAPGELIPPSAIADGIAFLVSDAARHISGSELDIAESRAATWN